MEELRNILIHTYQLKKELKKINVSNNFEIDYNIERIIGNIKTILERKEEENKHMQQKIDDNIEIIAKYF